jgi:CHAD domain-containing protein
MQGKWISDLTAETPVADAARRVMTFRLEAVRDSLGQALRESEQSPDHVHQLRVATRRAAAALDVFSDCLPPKVYKAARRQLRTFRRAAGEARDWDVLLARLMKVTPEQSADDRAGLDMLIGYAVAHRIPAQTRLKSVCRDYPFGFERFMAETVGAIRFKRAGAEPLASFARPLLARLLEELNLAQLRNKDDYEQLHKIRITGKRLRYAMEIFVDCFGPALRRQLCPVVGDLQELLGLVNDHFVAAQLYSELTANLRLCLPHGSHQYLGVICRFLKYHESQMVAGRRKFDQWWDRWQQPEVQLAVAEFCSSKPPNCHLVPAEDRRADGVKSLGLSSAISQALEQSA